MSHSTPDSDVAIELKRWLVGVTGGAIEVFVSADQDALPLGAIWPQQIPDALQRADIVMVLISPSSAGSEWVSYETGYAVGAGKTILPLIYPAFNTTRLDLPVQMHQGQTLSTNAALANVLSAVNKVLSTSFEYDPAGDALANAIQLAHDAYTDHWPLDSVALPSREAMYKEIERLVHRVSPEAHIQATAAIRHDDYYSDDPAYLRYIEALAKKCGDARQGEHAGQHTLFIYFPLTDTGTPPASRQRSIRMRQDAFKAAGASDRFEVRRLRHRWLLNVITIGDDHAIIAFPGRAGDPKMRHAVRCSSPEMVAKINHWFNLIVRPASDPMDPETLTVTPRDGADA